MHLYLRLQLTLYKITTKQASWWTFTTNSFVFKGGKKSFIQVSAKRKALLG